MRGPGDGAEHNQVPRRMAKLRHEVPDLPQLVIPELMYNALIASLSMAASYHLFSLVIEWWKSRSAKQS